MIKTFIRSALVILLLALILGVSKNVYTQTTKFQEIRKTEIKAKGLEKENEKLKIELEQRKSSFFIEKQARDKLGYQKEGDVLFVTPVKKEISEEEKEEQKENWKRWLDLLF